MLDPMPARAYDRRSSSLVFPALAALMKAGSAGSREAEPVFLVRVRITGGLPVVIDVNGMRPVE